MRKESIPNSSVIVHWRDEREGRAVLRDHAQWEALGAAFGFDQAPALPEKLENARYHLLPDPERKFPTIVRVVRKPQNRVQEAAWHFAAETRMARIEEQQGELGVHFLDEDNFIPFTQLDYIQGRGFRRSLKEVSAQAPTNDTATEESSSEPTTEVVPPAEQALTTNPTAEDSPPRRKRRSRTRVRKTKSEAKPETEVNPRPEATPEAEVAPQSDLEETTENGEP
jgi:hypothetical protein